MRLAAAERTVYADLWASVEAYGQHAPGEMFAPVFVDAVTRILNDAIGLHWKPREYTVLDAGCGSGKGGLALQALGFDVTLCDLTDEGLTEAARALPFHNACLWSDLYPVARAKGHPGRTTFDFVYCCDVLEHIPPQFTMLVVDQLLRVARRGVFLSISLVPDQFGAWVGRPLHQTVQSFVWWRDSLGELGTLADARDLLNSAIFLVVPTHGRDHRAGCPA